MDELCEKMRFWPKKVTKSPLSSTKPGRNILRKSGENVQKVAKNGLFWAIFNEICRILKVLVKCPLFFLNNCDKKF